VCVYEECLEGVLLRIVGHPGVTTSSPVDECKRALYDRYVTLTDRTEAREYGRSFPKDLLLRARAGCAELDLIIGLLE